MPDPSKPVLGLPAAFVDVAQSLLARTFPTQAQAGLTGVGGGGVGGAMRLPQYLNPTQDPRAFAPMGFLSALSDVVDAPKAGAAKGAALLAPFVVLPKNWSGLTELFPEQTFFRSMVSSKYAKEPLEMLGRVRPVSKQVLSVESLGNLFGRSPNIPGAHKGLSPTSSSLGPTGLRDFAKAVSGEFPDAEFLIFNRAGGRAVLKGKQAHTAIGFDLRPMRKGGRPKLIRMDQPNEDLEIRLRDAMKREE